MYTIFPFHLLRFLSQGIVLYKTQFLLFVFNWDWNQYFRVKIEDRMQTFNCNKCRNMPLSRLVFYSYPSQWKNNICIQISLYWLIFTFSFAFLQSVKVIMIYSTASINELRTFLCLAVVEKSWKIRQTFLLQYWMRFAIVFQNLNCKIAQKFIHSN